MPMSNDVLVGLSDLFEEHDVSEDELRALVKNKTFGRIAAALIVQLCYEVRELGGFDSAQYPEEFGDFYVQLAGEKLKGADGTPCAQVVRVYAAMLFLSKKRPSEQLTAKTIGAVLGTNAKAVANWLQKSDSSLGLKELKERLRK